jgi:hypothetical protein
MVSDSFSTDPLGHVGQRFGLQQHNRSHGQSDGRRRHALGFTTARDVRRDVRFEFHSQDRTYQRPLASGLRVPQAMGIVQPWMMSGRGIMCKCCQEPPPSCTEFGGPLSSCYRVTVYGFVDDKCEDCDDINATFHLNEIPFYTTSVPCQRTYHSSLCAGSVENCDYFEIRFSGCVYGDPNLFEISVGGWGRILPGVKGPCGQYRGYYGLGGGTLDELDEAVVYLSDSMGPPDDMPCGTDNAYAVVSSCTCAWNYYDCSA